MVKLTMGANVKTTLSLESQMNRLALEAGAIANVIDSFRNIIPNLSHALHSAYENLTAKDETDKLIVSLNDSYHVLEKKLPDATYTNLKSIVVSVPEGFKGNMLEYLKFLQHLSDTLFKDANSILGGYRSVLATFISNKEDKVSLQSYQDTYRRVKEQRQQAVAEIKKFFPGTATNSKKRLEDIVERLSEVRPMIDLARKLNDDRHKQNLKQISATTRECVELLDVLVKEVQDKGTDKVSGNAAMNIAEGAYEIGKFVELIAIHRTMVMQAMLSVERLTKQLSDVI